jgi:uncharacterized protein
MPRSRTEPARRTACLALALAALAAAFPLPAQQLLEDLAIAVRNDRASEVRSLLAKGMDPNSVDGNGDPLLSIAAREGSPGALDVLLAAKAKVDVRNRYGDTPIMLAALNGRVEIVKKLRAAGADLNPKGWTPLIYAATGGHESIVEYLIAQGADVNAVSPGGVSALMMAVREARPGVAELLLARGANVNLKSDAGLTALAYAKQMSDGSMVQRLAKAGARE